MAPSARDLDLRQHHGVEAPEHVDVRFELAGVGSRIAAALLDLTLQVFGIIGLWMLGAALGGGVFTAHGMARSWVSAVMILLTFCFAWGYFTLFEALNGGRTPGKQALGIRVVMDTGRPVTPTAAVVRNLVRILDTYFPALPFLPALLTMFLQRSNKRPGDMAAGTIVVRDRPPDWALGGAPQLAVGGATQTPAEPIEPGPPQRPEQEFRLLD